MASARNEADTRGEVEGEAKAALEADSDDDAEAEAGDSIMRDFEFVDMVNSNAGGRRMSALERERVEAAEQAAIKRVRDEELNRRAVG